MTNLSMLVHHHVISVIDEESDRSNVTRGLLYSAYGGVYSESSHSTGLARPAGHSGRVIAL